MRNSIRTVSPGQERIKIILEMVKQRAPLQAIANAIGLTTREGAKKAITRITKDHEGEVLEPEQLWTIAEAAQELELRAEVTQELRAVHPVTIRRVCNHGEIPHHRFGTRGRYIIDRVGMEALRRRFLVRECVTCVICSTEFLHEWDEGSRQVCSANACIKEHYRRSRANLKEKEPSLDSLRGWQKDLWERLQEHTVPEDEEWVSVGEAAACSGLSKMQVYWLQVRRIVTSRRHPEKRWRGQPVTLYASSEIEIARQVFEAYK